MCDVYLYLSGLYKLPNNHRQTVSKNGNLTIMNVQRKVDAGKYTCTAKNSEGQGSSRSVSVNVLGKQYK